MSLGKSETAVINSSFVRERIKAMDLKIWWISEQIGVDRKTLSRWLNGSVKWAKLSNLEALAGILECDTGALILQSETDRPVSPEEQKEAALLMEQENLNKILKPTYNWKLLESILRTTLQPNLPKRQLTFIYLELASVCMHQFRLDEAKLYARKAQELSQSLGHEDFYWRARNVESLCEIYHGNVPAAFASLEECLATCKAPPTLWLARHMLGEGLWRSGDYKRGIQLMDGLQEEQRDLLGKNVDIMNLSKNDSVFALLLIEDGQYDEARRILQRSLDYARESRFLKMIHYVQMLVDWLDAREKKKADATESYETQHAALKGILDDHLYYHLGAQIYYELGQYAEALKLNTAAIDMGKDYVVEVAMFQDWQARIYQKMKNEAKAREHRKMARAMYEKFACHARLVALPG